MHVHLLSITITLEVQQISELKIINNALPQPPLLQLKIKINNNYIQWCTQRLYSGPDLRGGGVWPIGYLFSGRR